MPANTDTTPNSESIVCMAALLLRAAQHEQDGLSYRWAILTAASDLGVDPAVVLSVAGNGSR
jgi:hypothetical protein